MFETMSFVMVVDEGVLDALVRNFLRTSLLPILIALEMAAAE
jgi:hypothetical protein